MTSDVDFQPFELDITEDVKALYDEHSRLADYWRAQAHRFDENAAEFRMAGERDLYEDQRDHAASLHESADLHEHTAAVLGIILGISNEEDA